MSKRCIEGEQGLVIGDMLTYRRLLSGKPQSEVASFLGVSNSTYHQQERCAPGVRRNLLLKIGEYLGMEVKVLMAYTQEVAAERDNLNKQLGLMVLERGILAPSSSQSHKLAFKYIFSEESPYRSRENAKPPTSLTLDTSGLPNLWIHLELVNCRLLSSAGKIPLIERVLTKPFRQVYDSSQPGRTLDFG